MIVATAGSTVTFDMVLDFPLLEICGGKRHKVLDGECIDRYGAQQVRTACSVLFHRQDGINTFNADDCYA